MASTRLPDKPLADIAGLPMVVRVAQRALASRAGRVVVAADHASIVAACEAHGKTAGFLAMDDDWAREYKAHGFRLLAYGIDQAMLQHALGRGLSLLRE